MPIQSATSAPPIEVSVSSGYASPPIRAGFVGITTEYWDMFKEAGTDPTQPDGPFEQALENLAPDGGFDLRIGGDTSDWTWWPVPGMARPEWARWTLTPTWMAVAQKLLEDLHAHLIIGINMEADNPVIAAAEVDAIKTGIGPSVPTTFELGNEPELYPVWPFYKVKDGPTVYGRPETYSFPQITTEWNRLATQLAGIRLAGVGYSSFRALPYVEQFLRASPELSLLTLHTYALTPQNCQQGGRLQESSLFDASSLQGLAAAVGEWTAVARQHKRAVRVDEINAVTCGGLANFSDSMGPSLWALNILPLYAQTGLTGVNFETRPGTAQNLIQPTATGSGWQVTVQPEYYGMLAFAQLTPPGSRILSVLPTPRGLLAWAVRTPAGTVNVVVTNVTPLAQRAAITVAGASGPATTEALASSAGDLTTTTGVALGGQTISPQTGQLSGTPVRSQVTPAKGIYEITVAPASATILSVHGFSDLHTPPVQQRVHRAAGLGHSPVVLGQRYLPVTPGLKASGGPDGGVPVRRPDPVGRTRARGPRQHAGGERNPQPVAQPAQIRLRRTQKVLRVDDRHLGAVLIPHSQQPLLLGQPDVLRLAARPRAHVRGDHLFRIANQQHVAETQRPGQVHLSGHMVRHVLRVMDSTACGQRRRESGDGIGEVCRLRRHDRLTRRVVDAGASQVGRVQRLVDDDRVRAILERAHHRRGDVPRPGPHRHANGVAHGATRARTSASTSSRYSI